MTEYEIIDLHSDSPEVIEQLGSKRKFWFRMPDDDLPWLFKYTRENTGEDWSEKIASEIAHLLSIPAAQVELATFMGKRGCASRSFVDKAKGFELIHGSEVLAGRVLGYEKSKQRGQSDHCIGNIITAVEKTFSLPRQRVKELRTLAGFIVLDAIICNTDRHHDNWGLLRWQSARGKTTHRIAPSFDHASSLGRELLAERRKTMLDPKSIDKYMVKGRGGIYWDAADAKGENPFLLAVKTAGVYPTYFRPWLMGLKVLDFNDIVGIVKRIPVEWMNKEAKDFCLLLMTRTIERLKEVDL